MKRLRILLSAYACEPGKGSEPGVGWHWAVELARLGHEVTVLTRANNRPRIEAALSRWPQREHLHFIYFDLPHWAVGWKKRRGGIYLHYLLWQYGAYRWLRRRGTAASFDWVHHITFVSARLPSFLGGLGRPFVFGPVAGGEAAPATLCATLPWRARWQEHARQWSNGLVHLDPLMRHTFASAKVIFMATEQTWQLIPGRYRGKTQVWPAIGVECPHRSPVALRRPPPLRLLYAGRLLGWKGIHLLLRALAAVRASGVAATLSVVGEGRERDWLNRLTTALQLHAAVDFRPWLRQEEMGQVYEQHDVFVYPSLHDSGGMAVLEAMAWGLPVICLALGGPAMSVNASCGYVLAVDGPAEAVVVRLADAIAELAASPARLEQLRIGARKQASRCCWAAVVQGCYAQLADSEPAGELVRSRT